MVRVTAQNMNDFTILLLVADKHTPASNRAGMDQQQYDKELIHMDQ